VAAHRPFFEKFTLVDLERDMISKAERRELRSLMSAKADELPSAAADQHAVSPVEFGREGLSRRQPLIRSAGLAGASNPSVPWWRSIRAEGATYRLSILPMAAHGTDRRSVLAFERSFS
jgi:hypothetical protein